MQQAQAIVYRERALHKTGEVLSHLASTAWNRFLVYLLNVLQYCKVISLQLIKINGKNIYSENPSSLGKGGWGELLLSKASKRQAFYQRLTPPGRGHNPEAWLGLGPLLPARVSPGLSSEESTAHQPATTAGLYYLGSLARVFLVFSKESYLEEGIWVPENNISLHWLHVTFMN